MVTIENTISQQKFWLLILGEDLAVNWQVPVPGGLQLGGLAMPH